MSPPPTQQKRWVDSITEHSRQCVGVAGSNAQQKNQPRREPTKYILTRDRRKRTPRRGRIFMQKKTWRARCDGRGRRAPPRGLCPTDKASKTAAVQEVPSPRLSVSGVVRHLARARALALPAPRPSPPPPFPSSPVLPPPRPRPQHVRGGGGGPAPARPAGLAPKNEVMAGVARVAASRSSSSSPSLRGRRAPGEKRGGGTRGEASNHSRTRQHSTQPLPWGGPSPHTAERANPQHHPAGVTRTTGGRGSVSVTFVLMLVGRRAGGSRPWPPRPARRVAAAEAACGSAHPHGPADPQHQAAAVSQRTSGCPRRRACWLAAPAPCLRGGRGNARPNQDRDKRHDKRDGTGVPTARQLRGAGAR